MAEIQVTDSSSKTTIQVNDDPDVTQVNVITTKGDVVAPSVTQEVTQQNIGVAKTGVQGPTGATGPQGAPGEQSVYVQATQPLGLTRDHLWVQTGLGDGTGFTIWFEDVS